MMDIIINQIVKFCFNEKENIFMSADSYVTLLCRNFAVFLISYEFNRNPFIMTFKMCYTLLVQPPL